jgi:hypothetical protein
VVRSQGLRDRSDDADLTPAGPRGYTTAWLALRRRPEAT